MPETDPRLGRISNLQPIQVLELLDEVKKMRVAQKGYFKEKEPAAKKEFLIRSKQLELSVDRKLYDLSI